MIIYLQCHCGHVVRKQQTYLEFVDEAKYNDLTAAILKFKVFAEPHMHSSYHLEHKKLAWSLSSFKPRNSAARQMFSLFLKNSIL